MSENRAELAAYLSGLESGLIDHWRERSKAAIYQSDPEAWLWDVLGLRWHNKQREIVDLFLNNRRTATKSSNGAGKLLALDTPIPTPTGWTTMGELQVGDEVFDEQGKPTRVLYVSPVQTPDMYRITFNDGATIDCCGDHQWVTIPLSQRSKVKAQDWRDHWDIGVQSDARDLIPTVKQKDGVANHAIPINGALQYRGARDEDLPIHPYMLGVWLGDGSTGNPSITLGVEKESFLLGELATLGYAPTSVSQKRESTRTYHFAKQGLRQALRAIGVLGGKHIPDLYLHASEWARREVLRGLMDTDGFTAGAGSRGAGIDLANERLAKGVAELVRSLGVRISLSGPQKAVCYTPGYEKEHTRYRMLFASPWCPFTPESPKAMRYVYPATQASRQTIRAIVSIEPIESTEGVCITVDSPRSLYLATEWMIPTHNTRLFAELITWGISTHDPGDLLVICSAPGAPQLKGGLFAYMDKNVNRMRARDHEPIGYLTDNNTWNWRRDPRSKAKALVTGRTPPRSNIVGTFQGVRAVEDGDVKTWVFIDEGGAVHDDLYVAAEAVTTGAGDNKIGVIGNPDIIGTYFQRIYEDKRLKGIWATSTISAFDLPTFTGEKVYDDPEMQRQMLESGMTDKAWVEIAKKAWGEDSGWYKSKVLGEFPGSDDLSFFTQIALNRAMETEIEPDPRVGIVHGADVADLAGSDFCKIYENRDGRVRHVATWSHREPVETENRIHKEATDAGAEIVAIDRLGVGAGPFSGLKARDRRYTVIGAAASESSSNPKRWHRKRDEWYDIVREKMLNYELDLDFEFIDPETGQDYGQDLLNQFRAIRYGFDQNGAIQLESKKELRKRGVASPDDLDALVFAVALKARELVEDPLSELDDGDILDVDPFEMFDLDEHLGMPI